MEVCQPRHFGSHLQTCMHILRPVIGLVEGMWWGDRLLPGGLNGHDYSWLFIKYASTIRRERLRVRSVAARKDKSES